MKDGNRLVDVYRSDEEAIVAAEAYNGLPTDDLCLECMRNAADHEVSIDLYGGARVCCTTRWGTYL